MRRKLSRFLRNIALKRNVFGGRSDGKCGVALQEASSFQRLIRAGGEREFLRCGPIFFQQAFWRYPF